MKSRGKALPGGGEPRERPGRLRGGRDAAPAPGEPFLAALVRAAVLAEAPVLVLVRLDPGDGAPHGRVVGGEGRRPPRRPRPGRRRCRTRTPSRPAGHPGSGSPSRRAQPPPPQGSTRRRGT